MNLTAKKLVLKTQNNKASVHDCSDFYHMIPQRTKNNEQRTNNRDQRTMNRDQ